MVYNLDFQKKTNSKLKELTKQPPALWLVIWWKPSTLSEFWKEPRDWHFFDSKFLVGSGSLIPVFFQKKEPAVLEKFKEQPNTGETHIQEIYPPRNIQLHGFVNVGLH